VTTRDAAAAPRNVFLHDVPLDDARARFDAALLDAGVDARGSASETPALADALERVTARAVIARLSSPHYHACAMDGVAVLAARTTCAPGRSSAHGAACRPWPIATFISSW